MLILYIFGFILLALGIVHLVYPDFLRRIGVRYDRSMLETEDPTRYEKMNRIRGIVLVLLGVVAIVAAVMLGR